MSALFCFKVPIAGFFLWAFESKKNLLVFWMMVHTLFCFKVPIAGFFLWAFESKK